MFKKNGFIHLHIGDGKGKTTAAAGMAVRAAGWKMPVLFCQFLKSSITGEVSALESLNGQITVFRPAMRHKDFLWNQTGNDIVETREDIMEGWKHVKSLILNRSFDLVILDEVLDVLKYGFIEESDLLETILNDSSDFVLTGREASDNLMEIADYITCMTAVKHPYQKGLSSRKGIEY